MDTGWKQAVKRDILVRSTILLLFTFLLFGGLYFASAFLIPISYAALLAMLLLPVNKKLERWGVNRGIAIVICILVLLIILIGSITLLSSQIVSLAHDLPALWVNMEDKLNRILFYVESQTGVSPKEQVEYLRSTFSDLFASAGVLFQRFLTFTTGMFVALGIITIYMFFFMYYRDKFTNFILKLMPEERHEKTKNTIGQISWVTEQYLVGKLIVTVILTALNTGALLIIGIPHAFFFGFFAALLNLIPYIGTFVGGIFPVIMALLTRESLGPAIAVAAAFSLNQFIENNFLTPFIVGSKVNINPLFTILAVILGGFLWGTSGMILFIPFLGIAKIIFDKIDSLKPYGYLIGDDQDTPEDTIFRKLKKRVRQEAKTEA